MRRESFYVLAALLFASATWIWVQDVAIAHQQKEAAEKGTPRGNLSDLYPRWHGARELLLHRRDPYGDDITREIQAGYYGRPIDPARPNDPKDPQAFAYPLYVVFMLAPTIGLPFPVVQKGFFCLLILLTAATVPLWLRVLRWRLSITAQSAWVVLMLGSFPAIQGLKLQQLTLLVAALVAVAMYAIVNRYFVSAGILLALASIKPQLIFLIAMFLLIWVSGRWHDRQRLVWSSTLSMAALVVAAEFLWPGWLGEFRAALVAYYRYTGGGKSVLDVALTPLWGRVVSAALVILALILLGRSRRSPENSTEFRWCLALVLATTLVVIPTFAPYNHVLLLAPLMLVVREVGWIWRDSGLAKFLLVITSLCVAWPWIAASGLAIALLFLPSAAVQTAWAVPLYTILWTPITLLALVLVSRHSLLRGHDGREAGLRSSTLALPFAQ